MPVSRAWPRPPDGAIHLIGDMHVGAVSMTANRKALWAADLSSPALPDTVTHVVVGDVVDHGLPEEDDEAVALLDAQFGAGNWVAAVGNHDLWDRNDPPAVAQGWGMPDSNFVHDLGFARLVVVCSDGGLDVDNTGMVPFSPANLEWMDDQFTAAGDTPCLVVCHWSLQDTAPGTDGPFAAQDDADVRALLADNANAVAWLSGHTHTAVSEPDLVKAETVGGHTVAAINASAICYTDNGVDSTDNLDSDQYTMYVTVTDGRLDVRFRNHGAGIWHVAGPDRRGLWSVTL